MVSKIKDGQRIKEILEDHQKIKEPKDKFKFKAQPLLPNDCMDLMRNLKKDSFENYGFGCILGNFLADAIGAKDEFVDKCILQKELDVTMTMPGGGSHKTAPGQGTDDSELGTANLLGIIDQNICEFIKDPQTNMTLNMDKICSRYKDWYDSDPFDCGSTTRGALGALTRHWRELSPDWRLIIRESAAKDIYKVSEAVNKTSKSNGSMMKICPLAVWAAGVIKDVTPETVGTDPSVKHYE